MCRFCTSPGAHQQRISPHAQAQAKGGINSAGVPYVSPEFIPQNVPPAAKMVKVTEKTRNHHLARAYEILFFGVSKRRDDHFLSWVQRLGHFCQLTKGWFETPEVPKTMVPIKRPPRHTLYGVKSGQHSERTGVSPLGWEVDDSKHLREEMGSMLYIKRVYHEVRRYRLNSDEPRKAREEPSRATPRVPKERSPELLALIRIMIGEIRLEARGILPRVAGEHRPVRQRRMGWSMDPPLRMRLVFPTTPPTKSSKTRMRSQRRKSEKAGISRIGRDTSVNSCK